MAVLRSYIKLLIIAVLMYQLGPKLSEQAVNETISGFDHLIVEVGGIIKRVPASTLLNSNNYKGSTDLNTIPDTSAIGNWYECTITGTYVNFGNQAANAYDRFYWNGATWDLYPYSQVYGSLAVDVNANTLKVSFPGFGTDHLTAAYGDHLHAGVYQPEFATGTTLQYFRGDLSLASFPASLPASDVYTWAKAATKPAYSYSEIGSTPTSLSQFTNDLGNYGNWITGISSADVVTALGYTPYDSANPDGYISTETDPIFTNSEANNINATDIAVLHILNQFGFSKPATGTLLFDGNFATTGEIQAWSDTGTGLPQSLLDALPIASTTSLGIMQVGTGLSVLNGVVSVSTAGGGTAAIWGNITGTLSDQLDLNTRFTDIDSAVALNTDKVSDINHMVFPGAGIALSTGTAWGTSITDNSTNWNTAYTLAQAALPASSYTAADVLAKIKTVDGAGSGLDADLLDGISSNHFRKSFTTLNAGADANIYYGSGYWGSYYNFNDTGINVPSSGYYSIETIDAGGSYTHQIARQWIDRFNGFSMYARTHDASTLTWQPWVKFYHSGNSNLSTVNWAANNLTAAGTLTVSTISDAIGNFLTYGAGGVLSYRTAAEVVSDLALTTADVTSVTDKRYVTDLQSSILGILDDFGFSIPATGTLLFDGNLAATGEIQAWSDTGTGLPQSLLDALPIASTTSLGIMQVGSGLSVLNGVVSVSTAGGGTAAIWGNITGTLSDQLDLNTRFTDIDSAVALNTDKVSDIDHFAGKTTTDLPEGTNLYYTETRVAANSAVALNTAKVSDINHMVYPGAGIALSTGTAWGTSITDNSANWNTAYGWGNYNGGLTTGYLPYFNGTNLVNSSIFASGTDSYLRFNPDAVVGVLVNSDATYTGRVLFQAGKGSSTYGGGLLLYGNSNATYPGYVIAGISSGSGGKFAVNTTGTGGGTNIFTVDASGNVVAAGTLTVSTISDAIGNFLTYGAGGVLSYRTAAEVVSDLALDSRYGQLAAANSWSVANSFVYSVSGTPTITIQNDLNSASEYALQIMSTGTVRASISSSGNITAAGEITAWTSSDIRLKTNVLPILNATEMLDKFNPVTFFWNDLAKDLNPAKDDRMNYGLIAQELESINPEFVHKIYDKYKAVDYEQIISVLIAANKELNERVKTLEL